MAQCPDLFWLPSVPDWSQRLPKAESWADFRSLAQARLDAVATRSLDRRLRSAFPAPPGGLATRPVKLAILASSTVDHLLAGVRVAGLRRDIHVTTYTPDYGQYVRALMDPASSLHAFGPDAVLFAVDAPRVLTGVDAGMTADAVTSRIQEALDDLATQWNRARSAFRCQVIQQTLLPAFPSLLGGNEHRLPGSRLAAALRFNVALRDRADAEGVDLLSLDTVAAAHGLNAWHDPALWHKAKQEVHPLAAPYYGDMVGRLLGAAQGRSSKALVLDLDNTLWGGVIGDDGLAGIVLGQGSARGEAYLAFQRYARDLGRRGVILAVCSKNDEANAMEPFDKHPEMVLKRDDIACFVANWTDKATNLRGIAQALNIGLDSLVFVDDNPAERAIVRRELPMVGVPELPDDPTLYATTVAEAGYFESLRLTREDFDRAQQYQENARRTQMMASATDIEGYLRSLEMRAVWGRFDRMVQARVVQLINKTNQFNLTTRRVTDEEIAALIDDAQALTLQVRLLDTFGDNGIIAIVIGAFDPGTRDLRLNTWLMSCRVLGRGMEEETLNLIAEQALSLGASRLIGEYRPTAKNGMVKDHYARLGFQTDGEQWVLPLAGWTRRPTFIDSTVLAS